jgi:hypothetical protein
VRCRREPPGIATRATATCVLRDTLDRQHAMPNRPGVRVRTSIAEERACDRSPAIRPRWHRSSPLRARPVRRHRPHVPDAHPITSIVIFPPVRSAWHPGCLTCGRDGGGAADSQRRIRAETGQDAVLLKGA